MDSVLYQNTYRIRAKLARVFEITPQGLASKLHTEPVAFIVEMLRAMVQIRQRKNAEKIWADLSARIEEIFETQSKSLPLTERVRLLQTIIALEVESATGGNINRFELLDAWRELRVLSGKRITELTFVLEGSQKFAVVGKIGFWQRQRNKFKRFFKG